MIILILILMILTGAHRVGARRPVGEGDLQAGRLALGRARGEAGRGRSTASPPTKSLDFRGFDSSRLLILKGRNSHVRIIL